MIKDRLSEFQDKTRKIDNDDNENTSEELRANDIVVYNVVMTLREILTEMQANIKTAKEKHYYELLKLKSEKCVNQQLQQNVAITLDESTTKLKEIKDNITVKLKSLHEIWKNDNNYTVRYRMLQVQYTSLSNMFVDTMTSYVQIEIEYREEWKSILKQQVEEDKLQRNCTYESDDIEIKRAVIVELDKSIEPLHNIITDMEPLLNTDKTMLDRVEYHCEHAWEYILVAEMRRCHACYLTRQRKKRQCLLVTSASSALLVIVLIIYFVY